MWKDASESCDCNWIDSDNILSYILSNHSHAVSVS